MLINTIIFLIRSAEHIPSISLVSVIKVIFNWFFFQVIFDVKIENLSSDYTQIAIQGPVSEKLLSEFTDVDLSAISYYRFTRGKVNGLDVIISRTGYTGEDGFEIYFVSDEDKASQIFLDLVEEGKKYDVVPVGLGARDTLRLEAKMALYGNDIDDSHTVLEADLAWILKFKKGDFIGRDPLLKQKEEGVKRKLVGFEVTGKALPVMVTRFLWITKSMVS